VCLIESRKFTDRDFARYHPGGALGKQLYLTVGDLSNHNGKPFVEAESKIKEVIVAITTHRLGAVAVMENRKLAGIITDGDIRRMLEQYSDTGQLSARDIMGSNPKTI